jgi:hypothetical protein
LSACPLQNRFGDHLSRGRSLSSWRDGHHSWSQAQSAAPRYRRGAGCATHQGDEVVSGCASFVGPSRAQRRGHGAWRAGAARQLGAARVGGLESLPSPGGRSAALSIEHRAAPSTSRSPCRASTAPSPCTSSRATSTIRQASPSPIDRLKDVLAHTDRPLTLAELRQACRLRTASVCQALAALTTQGRVCKSPAGYRLAAPTIFPDSFPATSIHPAGNGNG